MRRGRAKPHSPIKKVYGTGQVQRTLLPSESYNKRKKDAMKHKKDLKHKLVEVIYRKPSLGKKVAAIEKSMKEVNKLINDTK